MEIVTICSTKGGVGKTTISYNFGEWLAANGNQVLLIDLDQQCNLSQLYGLESTSNNIGNLFDKLNDEEMSVYHTTSENIDIIPGYKKLHRLIANIETDPHKYFFLFRWFRKNYETVKKYDYVIVDCHPSFDTLVKNAVAVSDVLFCPITPTEHGYDAKFTFMMILLNIKKTKQLTCRQKKVMFGRKFTILVIWLNIILNHHVIFLKSLKTIQKLLLFYQTENYLIDQPLNTPH